MNSSAETRKMGGEAGGHIRKCERNKNTEGDSLLDRRSKIGAALRVLCAQSCQRSPGQIVEEAGDS